MILNRTFQIMLILPEFLKNDVATDLDQINHRPLNTIILCKIIDISMLIYRTNYTL